MAHSVELEAEAGVFGRTAGHQAGHADVGAVVGRGPGDAEGAEGMKSVDHVAVVAGDAGGDLEQAPGIAHDPPLAPHSGRHILALSKALQLCHT